MQLLMLDKRMYILSIGTNKQRPPISGGRKLLSGWLPKVSPPCVQNTHQRYLDDVLHAGFPYRCISYVSWSYCVPMYVFIATVTIDTHSTIMIFNISSNFRNNKHCRRHHLCSYTGLFLSLLRTRLAKPATALGKAYESSCMLYRRWQFSPTAAEVVAWMCDFTPK